MAYVHGADAISGTFEASSVPILQIDVVKFVPRASQGRTSNPYDHLNIVLHPYPDLGRRGIWMRQNHEKQLTTSFMMKPSFVLAYELVDSTAGCDQSLDPVLSSLLNVRAI